MHRPDACAHNLKIAKSLVEKYQLKEALTRLFTYEPPLITFNSEVIQILVCIIHNLF